MGIIKTLRPHQWVKNLFVVVPLIYAQELFDWTQTLFSIIAFFIFSFLAGAVYTLNDLIDVERDKLHPIKCNRPIASGKVPTAVAASMAAALTAGSLVGAAIISLGFAAVAAAYLLVNVAYSFKLKHWPYVDVLCIAFGFLLRILAGAQAIGVAASGWLLLCTFLLALFLALGKRRQEIVHSDNVAPRPVLSHYNPTIIMWGMRICALLTLVAYSAYTIAPTVQSQFGTTLLPIGIPFAGFGLFRFLSIVDKCTQTGQSPTEAMMHDIPFVLVIVVWVGVNIYLIY